MQEREQKALEVYIKLLKSKGFSSESIETRIGFLKRLTRLLSDAPQTGSAYRAVLEKLMGSFASGEWSERLAIAREYYPFWMSDFKIAANVNQNMTEDALQLLWKPAGTALSTLWRTVDKEKFDSTDSLALKAYTEALSNENASKKLIKTRVKLAKVLLMRLKGAPAKDGKVYRSTVDATLPLFEVKESRSLFLVVVREFYHFWIGNPNAEQYILNKQSTETVTRT